jgi:hypothetical protein
MMEKWSDGILRQAQEPTLSYNQSLFNGLNPGATYLLNPAV